MMQSSRGRSPLQTANFGFLERRGGHPEALTSLKLARQLGVWVHRTYGVTLERIKSDCEPQRSRLTI